MKDRKGPTGKLHFSDRAYDLPSTHCNRRSATITTMRRNAVAPKHEETRSQQFGIGDPALAEYLGIGSMSGAGVEVTEHTALGLSAYWRAVSLCAGTIAALPLKTYRRSSDTRERISSFLDQPHPDMTQFEWTETVVAQLMLWGNNYLMNIYGGASQIIGLSPLNPMIVGRVTIDKTMGKIFPVRMDGGTRNFTSLDLTHIPGLNYDGIVGLSPIGVARQSLGTALAGDRAAARMYKNGMLLGGLLSLKDSATKTQVAKVLQGLRKKAGVEAAGDVAFVPAQVDFKPWTMSAADAQFLESRQFGIDEVARWTGVPKELLSATGATSWGTGIQELVKSFKVMCLMGWTSRIEQRLSLLLPRSQFCEFDYSGLLQPSPEQEIDLLIRQVQAEILTVSEARAIRNLPPRP